MKVERFEENSNWHIRKCGSVGVSSTQHGKREMLGRCGDLRRCAFSDFFRCKFGNCIHFSLLLLPMLRLPLLLLLLLLLLAS